MIGQMQGKFQMVVVPGTGHMLHEVYNPVSLYVVPITNHSRRVLSLGRSYPTGRDFTGFLEEERAFGKWNREDNQKSWRFVNLR